MNLHLNMHACRSDDMECRLAKLANAGAEAIDARLAELEGECTAGRIAKGILAVAVLVGAVLTASVDWWWIVLPAVAGLLLFQYLFARTSLIVRAIHGLGFRTRGEVEQEKFALRALRGDFRTLPTILEIEDADEITRLEGEGGLVRDDEERKVDSKDAVKEVLQAAQPVEKS